MADHATSTRTRLLRLPRAERREALADLVRAEFARVLLFAEDETPPDEANYFDLGLSSLRAAEIKQRLETELDCDLDAAALFGCATIRQLTEHLAALVLPEAEQADPRQNAATGAPTDGRQPLVDELIQALYRT